MKPAYYNEIDPYAAEWLRNLIVAGEIPYGDVDERSIEDVRPSDLSGYGQRHFFAGIGIWARACRDAGLPDDADVTTGSCPCQPFSAAGKGTGFADERHLWPAFHYLIDETRPGLILGEQVASAAVGPWLDLVQADLEGLGYAFGAVAFPAAGVGAPHIRDRTYWMAHALPARRAQGWPVAGHRSAAGCSGAGGLADTDSGQCNGLAVVRRAERDGQNTGRSQSGREPEPCDDVRGLADADDARSQGWPGMSERATEFAARANGVAGGQPAASPINGFWRNADWIFCRDGKWRPVEPGTQPLARRPVSRVGRLRAYGNAIVLPQATEFVQAAMAAATLIV